MKDKPAIRSSELLTRKSSFAKASNFAKASMDKPEDTILRSESPDVGSERRMVRGAGFEPATPCV
jgi:hypothetical protein